jgi:hypothetical protein
MNTTLTIAVRHLNDQITQALERDDLRNLANLHARRH